MRYTPPDTELAILDTMPANERLHYATTRMVESEEIWSLGNDSGWIISEMEDRQIIPIWPYRQLALEYTSGKPDTLLPQATSLEHFVYDILDKCSVNNIWLEVFPTINDRGKLINSSELYEIFNGMLETNEYFIEG